MNVIVAASGGVAALKTPSLLRRFREAGHEVRAAATEDAYHFVTELSLAVAAGSEVFDRTAWFKPDGRASHIELARWADVLVVAPATADALASAATGRADDVISALVVTGVPKVVWVPAMNTAMWEQFAVRRNVETLREAGHSFLGPVYGALAARGEGAGMGRMLEPPQILSQVQNLFKPKDFAGRKVLVSAGPTREYLDPVRFISNPSSGKMGYAVAEAAQTRGADVTLVSGPSALAPPVGVKLIQIESAEEMLEALRSEFATTDVLVMSAAVADWKATHIPEEKQAKLGETQSLGLVRTPDILSELKSLRDKQIVVGFAMETHEGVARAADKAKRKGLDFICLNYPTKAGTAFGGDDNEITVVTPDGVSETWDRASKRELADKILDRVLTLD